MLGTAAVILVALWVLGRFNHIFILLDHPRPFPLSIPCRFSAKPADQARNVAA
jgi:hypothetical protein